MGRVAEWLGTLESTIPCSTLCGACVRAPTLLGRPPPPSLRGIGCCVLYGTSALHADHEIYEGYGRKMILIYRSALRIPMIIVNGVISVQPSPSKSDNVFVRLNFCLSLDAF